MWATLGPNDAKGATSEKEKKLVLSFFQSKQHRWGEGKKKEAEGMKEREDWLNNIDWIKEHYSSISV